MKKISIAFLLVAFVTIADAQEILQYKYWIGFTDKKNSPYSIEKPREFLSTRALDRRSRLGIKVDSTDIPVTPAYIEKIAAAGVEVRNRSRWFNGVTVYMDDTTRLRAIRELPCVKEVRLMGMEKLRAIFEVGYNPEELLALLEKKVKEAAKENEGKERPAYVPYSDAFYGDAQNQVAMCNANKLHQAGFTGKGVWIAVLDAGFLNYQSLPGLKKMMVYGLITTKDFVQCNDTVWDDDDHGTNVLSCMAAYDPLKMVGTAPDASYLLLRCEDAESEYPIEEANWLCAAEFADSAGTDIITSSVGYTQFDDKKMGHTRDELDGKTTLITRAADMAVSKGIMVVNSAGNEGDGDWKYVGAPADARNIFTIGSVNGAGKYSSFSSTGPTKDGRLKPTLATRGELTTVLSPNGVYYKSNGTSFSTPVFSGMLACLFQANPGKKSVEIMNALQMSGSQYNKPDNKLGYGIPDFALANKILGGDKAHPLTGDDLLDVSVPVNSPFLTYTFHSATDRVINVYMQRDGKKHKVYKTHLQMKKGEIQRVFVKKYKKLKKGQYHFVLQCGPVEYKAEVEKK